MIWRAPLRTAAVGGLSALMLAAMSVEELLGRVGDERREAYARTWARSILRVLGAEIDVESENAGALASDPSPRLVVANHRSTLDIFILLDLFGGQLLARKDMASWPAIGVLARRAGTLFVDRDDPMSGAAAVQKMRERLRRKITLCVFPEGTTFAGDEVREFRPGAFVAIARERGSVLPVGIAYEQAEAVYGDEPVLDHLKRVVRLPRLRACVAIGSPRPAASSPVRSLAREAREDVQRLVHRARRKLGGFA
jgi:1-acyl-sn-glycerol-3-phosphate acyltransferase